MQPFKIDDLVTHPKFGQGKVRADSGETVLVRFEHGIEECDKKTILLLTSPEQAMQQSIIHYPVEVILKMMALSIRSVNDAWGVFSPSRIELLPHQLWVCRKVLERWPFRWLVADDVGLGKTIEAGIILWPLISRNIVKRLLIICPASLVEQWQYRLRTMFDIRLSVYFPEADSPKSDFWNTHPMVATSLQTIREDNKDRHKRILESKPWDLLIVDEAHHLNHDEQGGMTLGYSFLQKLLDNHKTESILFFTGTPHRGKTFGFFALLQLLRPDLFNPRDAGKSKLSELPQVMIRNNKECVTDIHGNKIFQKTKVTTETYRYSPEESDFYNTMTEFIASGKTYASTLQLREQQSVMLVLIAMQKLASSSIEAIKQSLIKRAERLETVSKQIKEKKKIKTQISIDEKMEESMNEVGDESSKATEEIINTELALMENEIQFLKKLIDSANFVKSETKIEAIIKRIDQFAPNKSILFFTEYKATQALLMSAIIKRYGRDSVIFINGDGFIDNVEVSQGNYQTMKIKREDAAEMFNSGKVRFLVSTEAAGEGIDLQENCHHLVHVDLPWNPMRMHQRVGRLNRYGQKNRVEVLILKNPDNVENRIWDILNNKIDNIMRAIGAVMDDREDLMHLILGIAPPGFYNEIFSESHYIKKDSLDKWFDAKTRKFEGGDVVDIVRSLVGNVQKFDFQQASKQIPKVDLPHIKPFFTLSLQYNKRQVRQDGDYISFKTPDEWSRLQGVMPQYSNVHFNRIKAMRNDKTVVLGVGHKAFDASIKQALDMRGSIAVIPKKILDFPLFVFKIEDKITGSKGQIQRVYAAVYNSSPPEFMKDWQLLEFLNKLCEKPSVIIKLPIDSSVKNHNYQEMLNKLLRLIENEIDALLLPFEKPYVEFVGGLLPDS